MAKKYSRKKLFFYIIMAIISFLMVGVCFYLGIKFDKHGKIPYVIIPVVLGVITFLGLTLYFLLKIYPYANEYDKKKLKSKTFKNITINPQIKEFLENKFDCTSGCGEKIIRYGLFGKVCYKFVFSNEKDIQDITQKIIQNNQKEVEVKHHVGANRFIDVYFIEIGEINKEIDLMEEALDEQYLGILEDPFKIILPLIYDNSSQKLYYYEKWTQANITLLRVGTNYIKKQIKNYQTNVDKL